MVIRDRAARVNKVANGKIDRNAVAIQIKFTAKHVVNGNYSKSLARTKTGKKKAMLSHESKDKRDK